MDSYKKSKVPIPANIFARNLATPIGKRVPINTPEANSGTVSTISLAHYKKNVKPINSEFIALIADKLQLQLKSSEVANF